MRRPRVPAPTAPVASSRSLLGALLSRCCLRADRRLRDARALGHLLRRAAAAATPQTFDAACAPFDSLCSMKPWSFAAIGRLVAAGSARWSGRRRCPRRAIPRRPVLACDGRGDTPSFRRAGAEATVATRPRRAPAGVLACLGSSPRPERAAVTGASRASGTRVSGVTSWHGSAIRRPPASSRQWPLRDTSRPRRPLRFSWTMLSQRAAMVRGLDDARTSAAR